MKTLRLSYLSFQGLLTRGEVIFRKSLIRQGLHIYRGGQLGGVRPYHPLIDEDSFMLWEEGTDTNNNYGTMTTTTVQPKAA